MLRIGQIKLATNLLLAPVAGYTDLAFRLIVRSLNQPSGGCGLAFTELLCSQAIIRMKPEDQTRMRGWSVSGDIANAARLSPAMWRGATCVADQPLGVQLYGRDPAALADAAQWAENQGAAIIDINMGCPVDRVTRTEGGSMLLCEPDHAVALARRVVNAVRVPVTVKMRLGWDDRSIIAPQLAPRLADAGVAAITVHGRTTEQLFRGTVRLEGIKAVVDAMKSHRTRVATNTGVDNPGAEAKNPGVPVIGNGDVKTPADARRMLDVTGCDGVMIGRGAIGQPWLFRDTAHFLATGSLPPPLSPADRARVVLQHFDTLVGLRNERVALNMIRARISWYSAGLQPWPGLRHAVRDVQSAREFSDFMAAHIAHCERQSGP